MPTDRSMIAARLRRFPAALACLPALVAGCGGPQSVLDPRSEAAEMVAGLWWVMLTVAAVVLLGTLTLLLMGVLAGRRGGFALTRRRGWALVLTAGVALPAVSAFALVLASLYMQRDAGAESAPDLRIEVVGRLWWWEVNYLDATGQKVATTANEIHIPAERNVAILLRSDNVIHSFWVPKLQGKTDLVPGRRNRVLLRASEPGVYRGQCAEFCGVQHAYMAFLVIAEAPPAFEAWLERQRQPMAAGAVGRGEQVFLRAGCSACHTVRGTPAVGVLGPDLTHLASRRTIAAGTLPNTRGHLGGWIADPQHVKPGSKMPPSTIPPEDFRVLLDWLGRLD